MLTGFFIILVGILRIFTAVTVSTLACVLVHELGHAIPTLLLSKQQVDIYIGSYVRLETSMKIKIGRLTCYIDPSPFTWMKGACRSMQQLPVKRELICIAGGPLASILLGAVAYQYIAAIDQHGFVWWCLFWICIFSLYFGILSLIPFRFRDANAGILGNDAYLMLQLANTKKVVPDPLFDIIPLVEAGKTEDAILLFENQLQVRDQTPEMYRLGVWTYMQAKNYPKALEMEQLLETKTTLDFQDLVNSGYMHSMMNNPHLSIIQLEKALAINSEDVFALTNISYSFNLVGAYKEAIDYANRRLATEPACAASLDNRGFAYLKTGLLEEGRADLETSFAIDNRQPETIRNLGLYHLLKKEFDRALELFEMAKALDPAVGDIDVFIETTKNEKIKTQAVKLG